MRSLTLIVFVLVLNGVRVSSDTPDVILDNIIDAKMCAKKIPSKHRTQIQITERDGILPEDNEHLNLYYGCMYQRKGIIDESGTINLDNLLVYLRNLFTMNQAIAPAQYKLIDDCIEHCKDVEGKDYGEKEKENAENSTCPAGQPCEVAILDFLVRNLLSNWITEEHMRFAAYCFFEPYKMTHFDSGKGYESKRVILYGPKEQYAANWMLIGQSVAE
ncbi:hypothetical protein FQR65_LT00814 [Abscondita terminalis]|nr:hypothetical protein FQR65_LT00814 [Abscondita terminalis]